MTKTNQDRCGLITTLDLSLYCGGKKTLLITRIILLLSKLLLCSITVVIISSSIESVAYSFKLINSLNETTDEPKLSVLFSTSIVKAIMLTVGLPVLILLASTKIAKYSKMVFDFTFPLIIMIQIIYFIMMMIHSKDHIKEYYEDNNNNSVVYTILINKVQSNVGMHQIWPSCAILLAVFTPSKLHIKSTDNDFAHLLGYIIVGIVGLIYGFVVGVTLNTYTLSLPTYSINSYVYDSEFENKKKYLIGSIIINCLQIIVELFLFINMFSKLYDHVESFFFSSWQNSKIRKVILCIKNKRRMVFFEYYSSFLYIMTSR